MRDDSVEQGYFIVDGFVIPIIFDLVAHVFIGFGYASYGEDAEYSRYVASGARWPRNTEDFL